MFKVMKKTKWVFWGARWFRGRSVTLPPGWYLIPTLVWRTHASNYPVALVEDNHTHTQTKQRRASIQWLKWEVAVTLRWERRVTGCSA